jgi:hypothetical protein
LLLALAIVLVPPYLFRSHLKVENVGNIQAGMTQGEVETLLGGPPGVYPLHGEAVPMLPQPSLTSQSGGATGRFWVGDYERISVWFIDDRVCGNPVVSRLDVPLHETIICFSIPAKRRSIGL